MSAAQAEPGVEDWTETAATRPCQCPLPTEEVLRAKRHYHSAMLRTTLMILVDVCRSGIELPPGVDEAVEALLSWPERDPRFDAIVRTLANYAENRTVIRGPEVNFTLEAAEDLLLAASREPEAAPVPRDPAEEGLSAKLAAEVERAKSAVAAVKKEKEPGRLRARLDQGLAVGQTVFHFHVSLAAPLEEAEIALAREGWQVTEKRYDEWIVIRLTRRDPARLPRTVSRLGGRPTPAIDRTPAAERSIDVLTRPRSELFVYVTSALTLLVFAVAVIHVVRLLAR